VSAVSAAVGVPLEPEAAADLWRDVRRWTSFVEGFARIEEVTPDWPEEGARVVWHSVPNRRGRVTERVVDAQGRRFATRLFERSLHGTQLTVFDPGPGGTRVTVVLEYELTKYGPLGAVADVLFVRRALRDALRRTLRRFAVEAEEEAGLR
jgi:uncharacterized membrane protein